MSIHREEVEAPEEFEGDEEAQDEGVDPFADLEPEVAERVRAALTERETQARDQVRQSLQQYGLDLTEDGSPAIRDPRQVSGWLGLPESPRGSPAPPPPTPAQGAPAPPPAVAEPDDAAIPDPVMDPAGFRRWQQAEVARATQPLVAELQQIYQQHHQTAIEIAMAKVPAAIQAHAPRFADLLNHPGFDAAFRQALAGIDPQQWKDPVNLARVAGMLAIDLDAQGGAAREERPRDEAGRFTAGRAAEPRFTDARDVGRGALSRATLPAAGPSREAGRQTRGREISDLHRMVAERLGISAEEAAALAEDSTGDASASLRKKRIETLRRAGR